MMTMLCKGDLKLLSPIFGDTDHDGDEDSDCDDDVDTYGCIGHLFHFCVIVETFPLQRNATTRLRHWQSMESFT